MISVNILNLFLKLQFLIEVQSIIETQLYPGYFISTKDFPELSVRPAISDCAQSFRFVRNNNKNYLGIKSYETEYTYGEVNSASDQKQSCIFTSPDYGKKDVFYSSKAGSDDFMFVINGCFILNDKTKNFTGLLVLMKEDWRIDFLKEGLQYLNISQYNEYIDYNAFSHQSPNLTHCTKPSCKILKQLANDNCSNNLSRLLQVYDDKELYLFLIISPVILIVFGSIFYFYWYRSD